MYINILYIIWILLYIICLYHIVVQCVLLYWHFKYCTVTVLYIAPVVAVILYHVYHNIRELSTCPKPDITFNIQLFRDGPDGLNSI